MESALYGIYALVVFVSEILLVRCAHSFDFWYVNNSCVNTVRQHFPWSILYLRAHQKDNTGVLMSLIVNNVFVNFPQQSIEHLYKQYSLCFRFLINDRLWAIISTPLPSHVSIIRVRNGPSDEQSMFDLKDLLSPNQIGTFTVHMTQIGQSNFWTTGV